LVMCHCLIGIAIQLDGRFGRLYIFVSDESLLDDGL